MAAGPARAIAALTRVLAITRPGEQPKAIAHRGSSSALVATQTFKTALASVAVSLSSTRLYLAAGTIASWLFTELNKAGSIGQAAMEFGL